MEPSQTISLKELWMLLGEKDTTIYQQLVEIERLTEDNARLRATLDAFTTLPTPTPETEPTGT